MLAVRVRFVLLVAVLGCAAALLVALQDGVSDGLAASSSGAPAPSREELLAPPSGTDDVPVLRTEFARSYRRPDGSTRTLGRPA